MLAHWDEVEGGRREVGHLGGTWRDLGTAAGSRLTGVQRIDVDPGKWSTPLHRHTGAEEIFYVLRGSGIALHGDAAFEVRPGDCLVHLARGEAHTLRAGAEGLDVLAFGERKRTEISHLPRADTAWLGGSWVEAGAGARPWEREAAAGEPEVGEPGERPSNVANVADVESDDPSWRVLAAAAGSVSTGLNWGRLEAGEDGVLPHLHSGDEEIYVVLEGTGELELWPTPQAARAGRELEHHPLRAGHVAAFPPGGRMGRTIRPGDEGITYLSYGTRDPADVCYYPRSNKIFWRGLGLIARLEDLDYYDGEPG